MVILLLLHNTHLFCSLTVSSLYIYYNIVLRFFLFLLFILCVFINIKNFSYFLFRCHLLLLCVLCSAFYFIFHHFYWESLCLLSISKLLPVWHNVFLFSLKTLFYAMKSSFNCHLQTARLRWLIKYQTKEYCIQLNIC